jgi:hypothetical protein
MSNAPRNVRSRTLAKAAQIAGGQESLRRRLNVSALLLGIWISGVQPPPTDVFLKAVDIVEGEMIDALKDRR